MMARHPGFERILAKVERGESLGPGGLCEPAA